MAASNNLSSVITNIASGWQATGSDDDVVVVSRQQFLLGQNEVPANPL